MKINLSLLLLVLIVGFLFWMKSIDQSKVAELSVQFDKQPQEYMIQAFVTVFTEKGHIKNQLSADYWAYFPETSLSLLTMPHLTIHKPDGTVWNIDAKRGNLAQPTLGTIEKITLTDQVVLKRPATQNVTPITLETETLDYHPKKQYVAGDQLITMTKPGLKITGIGLRAFLDKGSVELLHDVKTYYSVSR
jgi:LPS export ABC transporter protein LptC